MLAAGGGLPPCITGQPPLAAGSGLLPAGVEASAALRLPPKIPISPEGLLLPSPPLPCITGQPPPLLPSLAAMPGVISPSWAAGALSCGSKPTLWRRLSLLWLRLGLVALVGRRPHPSEARVARECA